MGERCKHCKEEFNPPADDEPFCCYECQEAFAEKELVQLRRKAAAFDVLVKMGWFVEKEGDGQYSVKMCCPWSSSGKVNVLGRSAGKAALEAVELAERVIRNPNCPIDWA